MTKLLLSRSQRNHSYLNSIDWDLEKIQFSLWKFIFWFVFKQPTLITLFIPWIYLLLLFDRCIASNCFLNFCIKLKFSIGVLCPKWMHLLRIEIGILTENCSSRKCKGNSNLLHFSLVVMERQKQIVSVTKKKTWKF